jgi:hypothetical protein
MPPRSRTVLFALAVALAIPIAPRASAAGYDFVVLASSLRPVFPDITIPPSIDDTGAVAFVAGAAGQWWVLVAQEPAGEVLTDYLIIDGGTPHGFTPASKALGTFTNGWVAYRTRLTPTLEGEFIARGDGDSVEVILAGGDSIPDSPPVNPDGVLALLRWPQTIAVLDDGVETVLFGVDQMLGDDRIDGIRDPAPDIDDSGRVAFFASFAAFEGPACDDKILLSGPAIPTQLAEGGVMRPDCLFSTTSVTIPLALNDVGNVAYTGRFYDAFAEEFVQALYVDGNVVWDERVPGSPELFFFDAVAVNDAGTVAFAIEASDGRHLYAGTDPVEDEVLAVGDALCDDTVTEIHFHRYGLNDVNELAFGVALSDGRRLIVRAEPSAGPGGACIRFPVPEPDAALGAIVAIAALAGPMRRRS